MNGPQSEDNPLLEIAMKVILPCFGGPYDGKFYPVDECPLGYKEFPVRQRTIYLWKKIKPEYLDFATVEKASKLLPSIFDETDELGPGSHLEPQ